MDSESTSQLVEVPKRAVKLSQLPPKIAVFVRYLAEGFSVAGAACQAGMSEDEARSALANTDVQLISRRLRRLIDKQLAQFEPDEARKVAGVSEAYLLSRAKALEQDTETPAAVRLSALKFMAECIGFAQPAKKSDLSDVSTAKLVEVTAKKEA